MLNAHAVINELKKLGTPERAKGSAWYFKTGKGQYGYGDVFVGVTVPEQRKVAKKYSDISEDEILKLLKNKIHESRFTALLILVSQYEKAEKEKNEKQMKNVSKFYLANTKYINNWDLVDTSASYILGKYLLKKERKILYKLAKSKNLWEKRISVVATFAFIRENQLEDSLELAEIHLVDTHDLMHKAVGWMLREVGKKSEKTLDKFLTKHIKSIPRTTLRYAIERFPLPKRKMYLTLGK